MFNDLKIKKKPKKKEEVVEVVAIVAVEISIQVIEGSLTEFTKKYLEKILENDRITHSKLLEESKNSPSYANALNDYAKLLDRIFCSTRNNSTRKKTHLDPPIIERVGTKKVIWKNFNETANTIKRDPDHIFKYFLVELSTTGSIDLNKRFLIKGIFNRQNIEKILLEYIKKYVTCNTCKGVNSVITRHVSSRIDMLHCNSCNAERSVDQISHGYRATAKGDRAIERNS